ncbi:MAG: Acetyltransferase domain [Thermoplasmata archaeon]|nr:Acetyltransferase domain [Thermoplasmata archaeon]
MLQSGEPWPEDPLASRLDAAYYALTRTTDRHFGRAREGWFLTGVAGLDAPTMNRAVIESADAFDVERVAAEAAAFFEERECAWSITLATFRDTQRWHGELVSRGFSCASTLDVLVREPGPLPAGPDLGVRLARPDELPAFTEALMDVFRMPRRFYPALLDMTEAWRKAGAKLYVVEREGAIVATTLLAIVDGVAGIYNVGTTRGARRQGLARALMARALEDARDADVVTLQVAPEGFVEGFYLDLGFQPRYAWRFYTPRRRGFF